MTEKTETKQTKPAKPAEVIITETEDVAASWQHAQENYLSTASAMSAEWCHFMGQRFEAYAHIVDDLSHCHDLREAWQLQSDFGTETMKGYASEASKLSGLIARATNGGPTKSTH
jgi:hypothetical protein